MRSHLPLVLAAFALTAPYSAKAAPASHGPHHVDAALEAALKAPTRTPAYVARDRYRHPAETLGFFGIRPDMTVVEIWPGGGWYTEILAPYLAKSGTYYAAAPAGKYGEAIATKVAADKDSYGKVTLVRFPGEEGQPSVPDGTADLVLTFRNVHNLVMNGQEATANAFSAFYRMLKPGGVLGVVDHRLPEDADAAREKSSGYVKTSTVIKLAEAAGFKLAGKSEVNANPADTTDHPQGVWTLPPTLKLGEQDRAKYLAIGESDRMTLKFVKPAS